MRVLALTNLYPSPAQPNRAPFNRQQFRALAKLHEVRIIAPVAWAQQRIRRSGSDRSDDAGSRRRVADGMIVDHPRYVYTPKVLRGWYGHFFERSVRGCFLEAVEDFRPDIVLGCWAYPDGWAAVRLARAAGLPVVVKAHGSDVLALDVRSGSRAGTIEALTSCDGVVTVSKHLAGRVINLGANPSCVSVVYNGVDMGLFHSGPRDAARGRLGLDEGAPLVLFVGNLVPVKGLESLLDALAVLHRDGIAFQAVCIGEGPQRARLEARAITLGMGSRIRLVGSRPIQQLPDWYRAASVCVLPSRSEGVPNVLLEARACGTPVVATNVGGVSEIVPREALVEPGNARMLAARIAAALASADRAGSLGDRTPATWDESARALANALQRAIHTPHSCAARRAA